MNPLKLKKNFGRNLIMIISTQAGILAVGKHIEYGCLFFFLFVFVFVLGKKN